MCTSHASHNVLQGGQEFNLPYERRYIFTNRECIQGQTVVAVTSGANIPFDRLRVVAELAELGAGREAMLASTITGRPGSLREVGSIPG